MSSYIDLRVERNRKALRDLTKRVAALEAHIAAQQEHDGEAEEQ